MAIIKTGRRTVLQPILIPLWVYLLHKSRLSRILICHCCFLCNNIITMMYYSEKGEESFIVSGSEKTRSTLLYTSRGFINPSQFSSYCPFFPSHEEGNTRERFSRLNKNHQHSTVKRSACVRRVSTLCIPGKHTGHTTGDLLHLNCTSWDEEIKQERFL